MERSSNISLRSCHTEDLHQRIKNNQFLLKLDRTNTRTKWESIANESEYVIAEMKMRYDLKKKLRWCGKIFVKYDGVWRAIFSFITLILNFILLISYDSSNGSRFNHPELFSLNNNQTKTVMLSFGCFMIFNWILILIPLLVITWTTEKVSANKINFESYLDHKRSSMFRYIAKPFVKRQNFSKICCILLKMTINFQILHFIAWGLFIILGIFVHPLYYAFLLTYVIVDSDQMNKMLKALWEPKLSIFSTLLLMILVVYMFVVLAYSRFSEDYPDNTWSSILNWFTTSFDKTLKESGLGNYLETAYTETGNSVDIKYERVIFDNIEFLLIILLLIGIISGIIIDKFGELRSQREAFEFDRKTNWFICGKTKNEVDKDLSIHNFDYHIRLEHWVWDYVFFIAYLRFKESENSRDLTYEENIVLEKLNRNDLSWFPCYL